MPSTNPNITVVSAAAAVVSAGTGADASISVVLIIDAADAIVGAGTGASAGISVTATSWTFTTSFSLD